MEINTEHSRLFNRGKMSAHPLSVIGLAIVTGLCIGIMKLAIKGTKKKSHHYLITFVIALLMSLWEAPYISELMYISLPINYLLEKVSFISYSY